ncbi:Cell wall-associated hydrolase, NlpC family [Paenibacillus sp. UNCCL117]|uniref:C40 family peptidase n=1 Tax=unclassified Paenibacillus TaxID=185978 RepID=UPI000885DC74|nr:MULTISPECIES: C40 family peptidase [unclassified Paenibacillus]SDD52833.1 Cell wall-associated hydrolase, NlpC family [Paenibacillus sp. cl123]SFW49229.1 Cell wall-associated hydrolase, NlpC family [Paenibacillus sp. UNCCL117]
MKISHLALRTAGLTAAITVMLTGALAGSASAAYDDMDAVSLAKKMVGKTYTASGETPSQGFDASGLAYYVFRMLDYNIPRKMDDQFSMSSPLVKSLGAAQSGDLLFFGSSPNKPSFSGIYVGDGKMVMASNSKDKVVTRSVNDFKSQYLGGRRVLSGNDRLRANLILTAQQYLGVPYDFGAKYGQTKTFDCSSFMKWVFNKYDIELPRVSRDQAKEGTYVSRSNLKAGDLVFFTTKDSGGKIGHVGMYVGDGMMIHTYGEGGVKFGTIESGWWDDHYVTARRVIK